MGDVGAVQRYTAHGGDDADVGCAPLGQHAQRPGLLIGFAAETEKVVEHAQAKLVRCLSGKILDVVVDLRKDSPTFKQVYAVELNAEKKNALLVPRGFAHGFSVLSETAEVLYKCDNVYNKQSEGGLLYNDPSLKIDWKIEAGKEIVSGKDLVNSAMADLQEDSFF